MKRCDLQIGDMVQLSPDMADKTVAGAFMVVTEPKPWGAQGYLALALPYGETLVRFKGLAYFRAKWADMEPVGRAVWTMEPNHDDDGTAGAG